MTLRQAMRWALTEPLMEAPKDPMLKLVYRWRKESPGEFAVLARILGHTPIRNQKPVSQFIHGRKANPMYIEKSWTRRMVGLALVAVSLLGIAGVASAQVTTGTLAWDVENQTPATVNTYTRTVAVDGVVIAAVPTCVVATAPKIGTTCSVPVTGLQTGTHAATVTYVLGSTTVSTTKSALSLTPGPQPGQPVNIRIELSITLTVP